MDCGHIQIDSSVVRIIAKEVEQYGIEIYSKFRLLSDLKDAKATCKHCHNSNGERLEFGRDTLDVWFISSVSHVITLPKEGKIDYLTDGSFETENSKKTSVCDMVIEGLDQHRGWFSSSLISALTLGEKPFASTLISHSFVSNHKGEKISKSKDNAKYSLQDAIKVSV